ncbi:MAG TPA: hypothetical protein PKL83_06435, partial [bacterium]|nr:hypothetical protein [bacterium]
RYGSHGDYYPIAFAPGTVAEAYQYTIECFNAAEESLTPVVLLTDGYIGHLYEAFDPEAVQIELKKRQRDSFGSGRRHFTGLLAKNGKPTTKNSDYYREWYQAYKQEVHAVAQKYAFYEDTPSEQAETLIISYGILSRVVEEIGDQFAYFRPIRIWPVLEDEIRERAEKYKNIVVIEMNDGQYAREVERIVKRNVVSIPVIGGDLRQSTIIADLKAKGLLT